MPLIRFVHAADLHLDSPFVGIRSMDADIATVLAEATFRAYDNIIDLCIREQVDALLVAGDVFDGADRSLRAQLRFVDGLRRLDEAGIRSFVCHGNHDPLDGWESRLDLPPGCHRFGPQVEHVPVRVLSVVVGRPLHEGADVCELFRRGQLVNRAGPVGGFLRIRWCSLLGSW